LELCFPGGASKLLSLSVIAPEPGWSRSIRAPGGKLG